MIKERSECVSCELPCIHENCPYYRVKVYHCDKCGELADIEIEGEHLCYDCAEKDIDAEISALSFSEKCELLNICVKDL